MSENGIILKFACNEILRALQDDSGSLRGDPSYGSLLPFVDAGRICRGKSEKDTKQPEVPEELDKFGRRIDVKLEVFVRDQCVNGQEKASQLINFVWQLPRRLSDRLGIIYSLFLPQGVLYS